MSSPLTVSLPHCPTASLQIVDDLDNLLGDNNMGDIGNMGNLGNLGNMSNMSDLSDLLTAIVIAPDVAVDAANAANAANVANAANAELAHASDIFDAAQTAAMFQESDDVEDRGAFGHFCRYGFGSQRGRNDAFGNPLPRTGSVPLPQPQQPTAHTFGGATEGAPIDPFAPFDELMIDPSMDMLVDLFASN